MNVENYFLVNCVGNEPEEFLEYYIFNEKNAYEGDFLVFNCPYEDGCRDPLIHFLFKKAKEPDCMEVIVYLEDEYESLSFFRGLWFYIKRIEGWKFERAESGVYEFIFDGEKYKKKIMVYPLEKNFYTEPENPGVRSLIVMVDILGHFPDIQEALMQQAMSQKETTFAVLREGMVYNGERFTYDVWRVFDFEGLDYLNPNWRLGKE